MTCPRSYSKTKAEDEVESKSHVSQSPVQKKVFIYVHGCFMTQIRIWGLALVAGFFPAHIKLRLMKTLVLLCKSGISSLSIEFTLTKFGLVSLVCQYVCYWDGWMCFCLFFHASPCQGHTRLAKHSIHWFINTSS